MVNRNTDYNAVHLSALNVKENSPLFVCSLRLATIQSSLDSVIYCIKTTLFLLLSSGAKLAQTPLIRGPVPKFVEEHFLPIERLVVPFWTFLASNDARRVSANGLDPVQSSLLGPFHSNQKLSGKQYEAGPSWLDSDETRCVYQGIRVCVYPDFRTQLPGLLRQRR